MGPKKAMNSDSQRTQKLNSFGENEKSGAPDTHELMQSLKATNAHFAYVLEGAGLGSWDWWLEDSRVHFDRRWCEIVGLRHEEIQQHLSTWDSLVHPDDKAQCYVDIKAYLDGKTPYYENIHRMKHANGSWVWILDRGRVSERDATGKAIRFTGTHLDITSYKESERLSINIQKMAQIGGWELQEKNLKVNWTDQTYRIFESPIGWDLTFKTFLQFFSNEDQKSFESLVERGF
jgi:PAS domain S-box-containing protein